MNLKQFKFWLALAATASTGLASQALAAGYEKSIMWGGRSAGVAGVATPYITGSQALYFNPAGIVTDEPRQDVSFNISPTWSKFKGPINNTNNQETSEQGLTTPFGLIYGNTFNDKWGFAIGGFASGGAKAKYEGIEFTGVQGTATVETDLSILEMSAGVGYKVNERLKLGAAYRYTIASAEFAVVQRGVGTVANLRVNDLKDESEFGFRLGAQYQAAEKTLIGLTYRSEVKLEADGTYGGQILNPGAPLAVDATSAKAKTVFPMQAALGVQHDFSDAWRFLGEYVWTQYSRVETIDVEGAITHSGGAVVAPAGAQVRQNWKDQHNVRLAGEYMATAWPIRFGYVYTSEVTDESWARATFTPPGLSHTLTLGTGKTFEIGGNPLQLDVAGEYTTVKGDGTGSAAGVTTGDIRAGEYEAGAYALHLGLAYAF